MRCPKSRFPIRIIVFDELELIIFVSQGLTLSTASLVYFIYLLFTINFFDEERGTQSLYLTGQDTDRCKCCILKLKGLSRQMVIMDGVWLDKIDCVQKVRVLLLFLL